MLWGENNMISKSPIIIITIFGNMYLLNLNIPLYISNNF